eukprot:852046-Pleurochrysis_carterae.AAC.1
MRRWDFVAAYLQGELEEGEVVYCHPPPDYETTGTDGRTRVCRILKLDAVGSGPCFLGYRPGVSANARPIRASSPAPKLFAACLNQ